MRDRLIGWMAVAVVASFSTQFTVGLITAEDALSKSVVLGLLNAVAWYGLTALAAVWLLRDPRRRVPALGIVTGQAILALPGILLALSGDYGPLPTWLFASLVGDAVIVVAGTLAMHSLIANEAGTEWRLWTWSLTRVLILTATAVLALSERMPRFATPTEAPLVAADPSFLTRIVTGPLPWRLVEVVGLVTVLAVGFAASTLRPRILAVAVGATLAVPAVPELLSVVIGRDPAVASGSPTGWLWVQTTAVIVLALGLVFLATSTGAAGGEDQRVVASRS